MLLSLSLPLFSTLPLSPSLSPSLLHSPPVSLSLSFSPPLSPCLPRSPSLSCTAMSFPHEDTHHANSLLEVREFLETRHTSQYLVFNLSGHSYDTSQLNNQVSCFDL